MFDNTIRFDLYALYVRNARVNGNELQTLMSSKIQDSCYFIYYYMLSVNSLTACGVKSLMTLMRYHTVVYRIPCTVQRTAIK